MNVPTWAVEPTLTQSWVNCTCVCRKECFHKGDLMAENESNVFFVKASGLLVLQASMLARVAEKYLCGAHLGLF